MGQCMIRMIINRNNRFECQLTWPLVKWFICFSHKSIFSFFTHFPWVYYGLKHFHLLGELSIWTKVWYFEFSGSKTKWIFENVENFLSCSLYVAFWKYFSKQIWVLVCKFYLKNYFQFFFVACCFRLRNLDLVK